MEDKLKAGHIFETQSGNFLLVLKVLGEVFVQDAFDGYWSTQSKNVGKEQAVIVWDGMFANKRSLSELDQTCTKILAPNDGDIFHALEKVNSIIKTK